MLLVLGMSTLQDRLEYKYEELKRWSDRGDTLHNNVNRKIYIIEGIITGNVVRPLARLITEQNIRKHRILSYVKYRYR